MSGASKFIAAMIIMLMVGLGSLSLAEHYAQDGVEANPTVKAISKKIDNTAKKAKAGAYNPGALGDFIPMP